MGLYHFLLHLVLIGILGKICTIERIIQISIVASRVISIEIL